MPTRKFSSKSILPVSTSEAFTWYKQKGAVARLTPPWENVEFVRHDNSLQDGTQAELILKILGPIKFRWLLEHRNYIPGKQFCDHQVTGPFKSYQHSHLFSEMPDGMGAIEDLIEYELPCSAISHHFASLLVENRFDRAFRYRHRVTNQDLEFHKQFYDKPRLSFLLAGATGMLGKALCAFLSCAGHQVTRLVRSLKQAKAGDIVIGPNSEIQLDRQFDCVINLAGEGIADKYWSEERKQKILRSRVDFSERLVAALQKNPPKTIISASGIGFYGDVGEANPDESSEPGQGFLSEVCQKWEKASSGLPSRDIKLRLAPVISSAGGLLKKMLLPFQLGLGASLGPQQFAWIAIDDVLRSILFIAYNEKISGPVNLAAPTKTSQDSFAKALGSALKRPVLLKVPAFILRAIPNQMGQELFLSNAQANPKKLLDSGFSFLFTCPEAAIRATLGLPNER